MGELSADVLVLFTFDNTLVDVDSNLHIAQQLDATLANAVWTKYDQQVDRAKVMDQFLVQLAEKCPQVSCVDIRNAAQRLPYNHHMVDAIRLAVDDFGATCKIVSDSTVFGVQSFVQHVGLADRVSEVVANPTHFENGGKVLRVRPYQGDHVAPHKCARCPKNLCKGAVVEQILQQHRYSRVLFVGEGDGDFCPSMKLAMDDVVFARADEVGLLPLLNENPDQIQAHIRQWEKGEDILAYFRDFFYRQYPQCRQANVNDTLVYAQQDGNFSVPTPMPRDPGELLVIFDFDDSLVNEDSDVYVFGSFHPELCKTAYERHAKKPIWPSVFDDMLQVLASEKPDVTPELIRQRVAQIPVQARMLDAVRMAVELFGADVKVISDGNTFYIESMLDHQDLSNHVKEVFANPIEHEPLDDGRTRLRIRPYHGDHLEPHGCKWCPTNMCKGSILDSIRSSKSYYRVIYVGDGTGDFCPASRLTEYDVVW
ncbi:Pyridoxal phosphate phosphatase [Phytophthora palmivora]|uniref:Pyridoxal phosphate phosphatase n=1 Tax=Phytophthora palmivora TaxID=4796 RepID=A0A2P4XVP0_9STRA|nr:Pyridoxal phosphate phosphatase [Phytophthora palmivora]